MPLVHVSTNTYYWAVQLNKMRSMFTCQMLKFGLFVLLSTLINIKYFLITGHIIFPKQPLEVTVKNSFTTLLHPESLDVILLYLITLGKYF